MFISCFDCDLFWLIYIIYFQYLCQETWSGTVDGKSQVTCTSNFTIRPLQRHSSLIALHQEDGIPLQSWQPTGSDEIFRIPVDSGKFLTYSHQKLWHLWLFLRWHVLSPERLQDGNMPSNHLLYTINTSLDRSSCPCPLAWWIVLTLVPVESAHVYAVATYIHWGQEQTPRSWRRHGRSLWRNHEKA